MSAVKPTDVNEREMMAAHREPLQGPVGTAQGTGPDPVPHSSKLTLRSFLKGTSSLPSPFSSGTWPMAADHLLRGPLPSSQNHGYLQYLLTDLKSYLKVTAETSDCAKSTGKHLNNLLG